MSPNDEVVTAMASDTSNIWIHNKERGLVRIGTGYYNTVRGMTRRPLRPLLFPFSFPSLSPPNIFFIGHIYRSKDNYRTKDCTTSLVLVAEKLYFYSHSLSQEHSKKSAAGSSEENSAQKDSTKDTKTSADAAPSENYQVVVTVLDSKSLEEEYHVNLKSTLMTDEFEECRMISNGRHLYFLYRKKDKKAKGTGGQREISMAVSVPSASANVYIPSQEEIANMTYEEQQLLIDKLRSAGLIPANNSDEDPDLYGNSTNANATRNDDSSYSSDEAPALPPIDRNDDSDDDRDPDLRYLDQLNQDRLNTYGNSDGQSVQLSVENATSNYVVEIYDPLLFAKDFTTVHLPQRSFELRGPELVNPASLSMSLPILHLAGARLASTSTPSAPVTPPAPLYDAALMPSEFSKGTFYTNGHHIVCVFPTNMPRKVRTTPSPSFTRIRPESQSCGHSPPLLLLLTVLSFLPFSPYPLFTHT